MFNKDRYLTRGIKSTISMSIIATMWSMIEEIPDDKRDYLQVFNLVWENGKLTIKHTQEIPEYEKTVEIIDPTHSLHGSHEEKIFVIDDGDYSTMLLAEEY